MAFANKRDREHQRSIELIDRLRRGEFGQPYTSDYVFDETVTTTLVRTGRLEPTLKAGKLILGSREESIPPLARLVKVDELTFNVAWANLRSARFAHLSFTDHTILAQMDNLKVDFLLSFDKGFDGAVTRIS